MEFRTFESTNNPGSCLVYFFAAGLATGFVTGFFFLTTFFFFPSSLGFFAGSGFVPLTGLPKSVPFFDAAFFNLSYVGAIIRFFERLTRRTLKRSKSVRLERCLFARERSAHKVSLHFSLILKSSRAFFTTRVGAVKGNLTRNFVK